MTILFLKSISDSLGLLCHGQQHPTDTLVSFHGHLLDHSLLSLSFFLEDTLNGLPLSTSWSLPVSSQPHGQCPKQPCTMALKRPCTHCPPAAWYLPYKVSSADKALPTCFITSRADLTLLFPLLTHPQQTEAKNLKHLITRPCPYPPLLSVQKQAEP